tara:strand:- start:134 stop:544 length:411 start_codon:yes stop_codon:yes gene_type:complete
MRITESRLRREIRRLIKEGNIGDKHLFFLSNTYEHHFMFNSQWLNQFLDSYNSYNWVSKDIQTYYPDGFPQIVEGKNCFTHRGVSKYSGGRSGSTTVILVPDDYVVNDYKNFLKSLPTKFRITTNMPYESSEYFQR